MKYAVVRLDGVTELRQSPEMPQDGIPLTDEQYSGIATGELILEAGNVVANPNYPPPPPPRNVPGEIDAIERQTLMPRATREFMLVLYAAQAAGAGITVANLLDPLHAAYSPAYAKLKTLDIEIAALRDLL